MVNKGGLLLIKLIPPPHVPIQILSKESWNMHRALALERLRLSAPSCIYSREISSGERNILCLRFNMAMPLSSEAIQSLLSFSWRMDNIRLHKVAYLSFLLFLNVMKFSLVASYRANPLFVPNQIFPFTSFIIQNTSLPGKLIGFPASFRKFFTLLSFVERILKPLPT